MLTRLLFLVLLCSSVSSYAQLASARPQPTQGTTNEVQLPLNPETHQVCYGERVSVKGTALPVLRERSRQWCSTICKPTNSKTSSLSRGQDIVTSQGAHEYQLQMQDLAIPYKLHYKVALHAAEGGYRYDISEFIVELYPDQDHPKSAFFPIEKYLEAIFIPRSNEEQMVAQFKQHVDDCAYHVARSIKFTMARPEGDPTMSSQATVSR